MLNRGLDAGLLYHVHPTSKDAIAGAFPWAAIRSELDALGAAGIFLPLDDLGHGERLLRRNTVDHPTDTLRLRYGPILF